MDAETTVETEWADLKRPARWPWVLVGVAVGVVGTLAVSASDLADRLSGGDDAAAVVTEEVSLETVEVGRADLIELVEWDGELGHGESVTLNGSGGTVTGTIMIGDVVERGEVLIEIDGRPVIAMYGSVPPYRELGDGDEGADVAQLEANLVALGFDPDETVTVDETFTGYTEAMVERWQEAIGVEVTGTLVPSDVLVVPGPSAVLSQAEVGATASGSILEVSPHLTVVDEVVDGRPVGEVVETNLHVLLVVNVSDADEFGPGDEVVIEQSDESLLDGVVRSVSSEVEVAADGTSTVEVLIDVVADGDSSGLAEEVLEGPVVVLTTGAEVLDALVVPTRALVALLEGGFAVEKVVGSGETTLVGVEVGAYDDGLVEISAVTSGSLEEGDEITVPR